MKKTISEISLYSLLRFLPLLQWKSCVTDEMENVCVTHWQVGVFLSMTK